MIQFDHIEVHVTCSEKYIDFLVKLFQGGRYKKISENNTYMYLSTDNLRIEVKEKEEFKNSFNLVNGVGFCLPCLRMEKALLHLNKINEIIIVKVIDNPDGKCYFFRDYEGIDWHIKDYPILDLFTNI